MRICVHGLGYIGLATASLFVHNGHEVIGYDTDERVRRRLERGEPDVTEDELESYVRDALDNDLTVSARPEPAEYHLICVPTPYDMDAGRADLQYVEAAARNVRPLLRAGDVVVLESTVPPGTTASVLSPILSESGLKPGPDIGLGYVPETMLPGNAVTELRSNDRILGGIDAESTAAIEELYGTVPTGELRVAPDATTAEFVKLVQNAFRDVNIAYANTLALTAGDYGVDAREAIRLANNHPRVDILRPGPGVGGHCLPVDPLFFAERSDETQLVDAARKVNDRMPGYVADLVAEALDTLEDKTVAILGVAYKGNVDDTRNSPGLEIARILSDPATADLRVADGGMGATEIRLCDPHVTSPSLDLKPISDALDGADAAVLASAHDEFADLDPRRVGTLLNERVVVDPLDLVDADAWEQHGFELVGI